ncbi:MAG TPA: MFS transporter [Jiangellaceae bacterium]
MSRSPSPTVRAGTTPAALLLAYVAFISLGLPDGLLGVGWPFISTDLGVPLDSVGLLLIAGTIGYMTASVLTGFTLARVGIGWLLTGSTLVVALALAGYSGAPVLAVLVGLALLVGLGSGGIDSGLNAYAAATFGPRHMNWMHAFFGIGMAIGPLVMTVVLAAELSWRWGYGVVAIAQVLLAATFAISARRWPPHRPPVADLPAPPHIPIRETLALPAVWYGALAFALYVAVEISVGLWSFVLLTQGRGLDKTVAGICVSAYWASLFVGRIVQGIVSERLGSHRVLRGSLAAMVAGTMLVAVPAPGWVAVAGLLVIGFAAAPVFPLLTLTTADRVGAQHTDRTVGVQMAAAGLGGAVIPSAVGVLLERVGVETLGPALMTLSVVLLVLFMISTARTRDRRA